MMVSLLIVKKLASKQVVVAMPAIISIIRKKNSVLNIWFFYKNSPTLVVPIANN
jgi:glutathionylspermidine synthase